MKNKISHQYTEVPVTSKEEEDCEENKTWKYTLRQLFVCSMIWTPYFAAGICFGTPTVFIAQTRSEANSTEAVSVEMASWLSSAFSYMTVPWCIILAFLTSWMGRKKTLILVSLNEILVAILLFFSVTPTHLLITELFYGLTNASNMTTCIISIVEYVSPKNRGFMMTIKSATVYWAILATNAIGTFAHWKYISILSFGSALYSLTVFFFPESPAYLARQGQYEECRKSHRWLKGCGPASEKELELLISTQIEERKCTKENNLRNYFHFLIEKEFYYPFMLSSLMMTIYQLSGKLVVTLYAIDILKELAETETIAYRAMLILDAVSVIAMYTGCAISKILRRRVLLFTCGFLTVLFLLVLSLYLYLSHLGYYIENKYISISLMVGFSVSIGLGPIILATSVYGELTALRYRSQMTLLISCVFITVQSVLLKNTPYIIESLNMHGMFLFYGISVSICLILLYKYLPETKDKTLEEIEEYFKNF